MRIQIQFDVRRVRRDRKRLEAEAVSAYINMYPQLNGSSAACSRGTSTPRLREAYTKKSQAVTSPSPSTPFIPTKTVYTPNVPRSSNKRHRTKRPRTRRRAGESRTPDQSRAKSKQSEITGQLAVAVAQQQAAQAAAAAKAVQAAQAARCCCNGEVVHLSVGERTTSDSIRAFRAPLPAAQGTPPARRPATPRSLPFSNASCGSSQAGTTAPSRRGARTWVVSNSAKRRGTKQPNWPGCRSSSTSPRTRRLRRSRTILPSRSMRPTASSLGTTPVETVDTRAYAR